MTISSLTLSAIDTAHPGDAVALVRRLDELGFHRYWATEHYSPAQSASPTVMASLVAAATSRIRVGSGGVMLRHANAMRVATDFHLLEALFPDRIDVGVIGNRAPDAVDARFGGNRSGGDDFPERFAELARLLEEPSAGVASIRGARAPRLWLCGVSPGSGELAGRQGACFAYGAYMSQFARKPDSDRAIEAYRGAFSGRSGQPDPQVLVSCFGACAADAAEAERIWRPLRPAVPSFIGTPDECREQLLEIAARYDTGEIMIQCYAAAPAARIAAYEALADACLAT